MATLQLGSLVVDTHIFQEEYDNGNSGTSKTVDWGTSNKQLITLTNDCTLTFTDPSVSGYTSPVFGLCLRIVQDATGGWEITWPGSDVLWQKGTPPVLSTAGNAIDIVHFYFRDDLYYGTYAKGFA